MQEAFSQLRQQQWMYVQLYLTEHQGIEVHLGALLTLSGVGSVHTPLAVQVAYIEALKALTAKGKANVISPEGSVAEMRVTVGRVPLRDSLGSEVCYIFCHHVTLHCTNMLCARIALFTLMRARVTATGDLGQASHQRACCS